MPADRSLIVIGKITRPHGIRGELCVQYYAESYDYFDKNQVLLKIGKIPPKACVIKTYKEQGNMLILKIAPSPFFLFFRRREGPFFRFDRRSSAAVFSIGFPSSRSADIERPSVKVAVLCMVPSRSGPGRCQSGVLFPSGCAGALPPAPLRGSRSV